VSDKKIPQPVIAVRNLKKSFGAFTAVNDISFCVDKGLCFGILGPNGAGKTSTIKMIYGFSPLTSGDIFVFGLDIKKQYRIIKARIGVCQQDNTLDPDLTVMQNFEVFARYFALDKKTAIERALSLLKFFALEQRRDARVTELSGGMVRRLVIARALINQPDLLILDDWASMPLVDEQRRALFEILEDRYDRKSTLVAAQIPVEKWHEALGNPTLSDAILDRLVHNAHKVTMKGESMRKTRRVVRK